MSHDILLAKLGITVILHNSFKFMMNKLRELSLASLLG